MSCMAMIAMAMNDLNYAVDKQPTSSGVLTSAFAAIRCSTTGT